MGSQVLKLLLTTRNFWLLSPSSSSELLLPSQAMDIMVAATVTEVTVEGTMVVTEATTTARGPLMLRLRLRLMLSPPPLLSPVMAIMVTDTDTLLLMPTDITTTARGLLMPSPVMATTGDTTEDTMVATEDTTTARGLLMLSLPMGTMVTDMVTALTDTEVMVMEATEATTTVEKFQKFMLIPSDFRVQYK